MKHPFASGLNGVLTAVDRDRLTSAEVQQIRIILPLGSGVDREVSAVCDVGRGIGIQLGNQRVIGFDSRWHGIGIVFRCVSSRNSQIGY